MKLARNAGDANKASGYAYKDQMGRVLERAYVVVRAPQGQWIGLVTRPCQNEKPGWETLAVNIQAEDLAPKRAIGRRA